MAKHWKDNEQEAIATGMQLPLLTCLVSLSSCLPTAVVGWRSQGVDRALCAACLSTGVSRCRRMPLDQHLLLRLCTPCDESMGGPHATTLPSCLAAGNLPHCSKWSLRCRDFLAHALVHVCVTIICSAQQINNCRGQAAFKLYKTDVISRFAIPLQKHVSVVVPGGSSPLYCHFRLGFAGLLGVNLL